MYAIVHLILVVIGSSLIGCAFGWQIGLGIGLLTWALVEQE